MIGWLINSDLLNWSEIKGAIHPVYLPIYFALTTCALFLISERLRQLLVTQNHKLSVWESWKLFLIGHFFNFVLPGGVGGDLVKAYYLKKGGPAESKTSPYTVIFDRFLGLYVMMAIAICVMVFHMTSFTMSPQLLTVATFVTSVFLGLNALAITAFIPLFRNKIHSLIPKKWPRIHNLITSFISSFEFYSKHPKRIAVCIALSAMAQMLTICSLYVIGLAVGGESIPFSAYFFVGPIGLALAGLPIVPPGGIGAGQAAFLVLFNIYLGHTTTIGPTVATVLQFTNLCIGFVGLFFYIRRKKAT